MKTHPVVALLCAELKPHPRNYRQHPPDQLAHIKASLERHGFYRNIVVAKDNTILAGHGVVQAAQELGLTQVPGIRLPLDPLSPAALQVLTGDNEMGHLGIVDDRALTELLKELRLEDPAFLLGTGINEEQLAALALTTRRAEEIADKNAAAEWLGMPEYGEVTEPLKLIISFRSQEDRLLFAQKINLDIAKKEQKTWMTWYPFREADDLNALRFEES